MDCKYCETKMYVVRTIQKAHDLVERERRCPTCKRRTLTLETIIKWLSPVNPAYYLQNKTRQRVPAGAVKKRR